jgi:methyl-accepting chemotaxis protein
VAQSAVKVGELVAEISAASGEQSTGIDQINRAVSEMDKVVQQSAANAEETASASEEMNAQAEQVRQVAKTLLEIVGGSAGETLAVRGAAIAARRRPSGKTVPKLGKKIDPERLIPLTEEKKPRPGDEFHDF